MRSLSKRFLLALFLTFSGVMLTLSYYYSSKPKTEFLSAAEPIAFVVTSNGVHSIRNTNSQLWTPASEGDPLFPGDSLKTGERGDLRLSHVGSNGTIELEPDTEILLGSTEEPRRVDLVEGFIFSKDYTQGQVFLKNSSENVSWHGRQTASRATSASELLINQKSNLNFSNEFGIQWTGIATDFETKINPEEISGVDFTWTGGKPEFDLWLEWGPSRKKMTDQAIVNSLKGIAKVIFPMGRHFYRWSLRPKGDTKTLIASPTAVALISAKYPPAAISPIANQIVRMTDERKPVDVRWQGSKKFSHYKLEISKLSNLANPILEKDFPAESEIYSQKFELGTFYWRISGYDESNKEWIRSRVHAFKHLKEEVNRVVVKFITRDDEPLRYSTPEPSAHLKWTADHLSTVKTWRVRWVPAGEDLGAAKPVLVSKPDHQLTLPRPGLYRAQVDALNIHDDSIGQSSILNFEVLPYPKLRAPSMAQIPATASANNRGTLLVSWPGVENAKSYQLELKGLDQPTQFFQTRNPQFAFQKLMPGNYDLRIVAIDESGRPGELSERRQVVVPAVSAVKALKVRKVEVQ